MNEPILIRKLPASKRPLARRCRTWLIRMMARRQGVAQYLSGSPPGPCRDEWTVEEVCSSAAHVGVICGFRVLPNMNRRERRTRGLE